MKKQNVYTVKEATDKLMRYCTYRERCHKEVEQKLQRYHLDSVERQEVISNLISENFLNEERFAKAFVRDKFNLQKWGKRRITRELEFRRLSPYLIDKALAEIDDSAYNSTFEKVFHKRLGTIKESHPLKRKRKLVSFMLRRGYEPALVYKKLNDLDL